MTTAGPLGTQTGQTGRPRRRRPSLPSTNGSRRQPAALDDLDAARDELRSQGRAAMGVSGIGNVADFRHVLRRHGLGVYPLVAVSLLVAVDEFQRTALTVLGPEISRSFGIGRATFGMMVSLSLVMVFVGTLPMAAFVQRRARRAAVSIATAITWSVTTLYSGFVRAPIEFAGVLALDGATTGSVAAVHQPLLFDTYPPDVRVRALSFYRAADQAGRIVAPAIVALTAGVFGMTWRGTLLVMGGISLLVALYSVRLRDPGFGRWDTERIGEAVRERAGEAGPHDDEVSLGFWEIVTRLFQIPTVRRLLAVNALLGMMLTPLITFISFYLEDRFRMGPGARGVFAATTPFIAVLTLGVASRFGEQLYRRDPALLMRRAGLLFLAGITALFLGVLSPWLVGTWLGFGAFQALLAVLTPALMVASMGIVPPRMRPHLAAVSGIFLFGVGGFTGLFFLGGIDGRYGLGAAILALSVPSLAAVVVLHSAGRTINGDLDRMVEEVIEEEEVRTLAARGTRLPLLGCRRIDFSYGQLQVLFDVSLEVTEGEMIALLGTNGAGKSTLLRVVSGLGLPSRGSVRLAGHDITFVDPTRRVHLGIAQVPGGRSTFPSMTVVENLRAHGYMLGRDRRTLEARIDDVLDAFPALAGRRHQPAATLSGGEAQMLALGKALLLRPRILLIDELSLGLAPKVVGELLQMVRRINSDGTAVVLVEQSVNIALSLVDHAYFMEKGRIRFDGAAAELLGRDDLLRSVFLEGAGNLG